MLVNQTFKVMKKVEKVVVVHMGEGASETLKKLFWKWFGSDVLIKSVHYVALIDEFEFGKHADIVVCLDSVNNHAGLILSQWPYDTQMICLGKPRKVEENIDYVPRLEDWENSEYLPIRFFKKRRR